VVHLVKGYIGCGILSLPWAISQLGIPLGLLGILFMAVWTSYNCWTVVKTKQYIQRVALWVDDDDDDTENGEERTHPAGSECRDAPPKSNRNDPINGRNSLESVGTTATTYAEVGEWAYGVRFHVFVAVCICAQQLAICTVFLGFVGENIRATLAFWNLGNLGGKAATTLCLPVFLGLSCSLPTVRSLSTLMVLGTVLMLAGFAALGWIGFAVWEERPAWGELPILPKLGTNDAPMALCGILYSFEGICIILPVESSMRHPTLRFKSAFGCSMALVTLLLAGMAGLGVLAFGEVSNGSITAFLLERFGATDPRIASWAVLSNLLVTLSIVFTFPIQLYPAVELLAPAFFDWTEDRRRAGRGCCNGTSNDDRTADDDDEDSLGFSRTAAIVEGFEPMVGIPENRSMHEEEEEAERRSKERSTAVASAQPESGSNDVNVDAETAATGEATDGGGMSDSSSLLSLLSNISYQPSIVESVGDCRSETVLDNAETPSSRTTRRIHRDNESDGNPIFEWVIPGDSPMFRAWLILGTYLVAILVPNVQSLVSLVGSVTGSSTALLIPPILELAYIRHRQAWESRFLLGDREPFLGHGALRDSIPKRKPRRPKSYFFERILSWCSLILGSMFALIGSYFSVKNIVESYA